MCRRKNTKNLYYEVFKAPYESQLNNWTTVNWRLRHWKKISHQWTCLINLPLARRRLQQTAWRIGRLWSCCAGQRTPSAAAGGAWTCAGAAAPSGARRPRRTPTSVCNNLVYILLTGCQRLRPRRIRLLLPRGNETIFRDKYYKYKYKYKSLQADVMYYLLRKNVEILIGNYAFQMINFDIEFFIVN